MLKKTHLIIEIDPEQKRRLSELAQRNERDLSKQVRFLIEQALAFDVTHIEIPSPNPLMRSPE